MEVREERFLDESCTGCGACFNVCPVRCIRFITLSDGFDYPFIDQDRCIKCGQCENVCPALKFRLSHNESVKDFDVKAYAAYSKDVGLRNYSTSGGIFGELAKYILGLGGLVAGAAYNKQFVVKHKLVDKEADLGQLLQSKYVQSDTNMIYEEVFSALKKGKWVLFSGAPCQCSGLKEFLGKDYDKLLIVDFICRGILSPVAFREYLRDLERINQSNITKIWFKNKVFGWHSFCTKVTFDNNASYYADRFSDPYMSAYLKYNLFIRSSCKKCQFKGLTGYSDIKLGDFWGLLNTESIENIENGVSVVLPTTNKGQSILDKISSNIYMNQENYKEVLAGNACLNESVHDKKVALKVNDLLGKHGFFDLIELVKEAQI